MGFNDIEEKLPGISSISRKNQIYSLWEELEILLNDDKEFQIIDYSQENMNIRAIKKISYDNSIVIAKIFGLILPINSDINLRIVNYREDNPENDCRVYEFEITTKRNLFYKGKITIFR